MTMPENDRVELGQIVGVFSYRGEVRVHLHNREGDALSQERPVILVGPEGEERKARMHVRSGAGKRILGRIKGIITEEAARELQGWVILMERADMPETEDGTYYVHDLLDLPVEDDQGKALGTLIEVVPGPQDVWVIDPGEGVSEPLMLIAVAANIVSVDIKARRIVVRAEAVS